MTYIEFKKILLDLDMDNREFAKLFRLNPSSISNMKAKGNVSKMLETYIILLQAFGKDKVKEVLVG